MPDGSCKYLRVVGHPSTNDESGDFEFVGAVTDITERKRAEADLQKALDEIKKLRDQLYKENIALREEVEKELHASVSTAEEKVPGLIKDGKYKDALSTTPDLARGLHGMARALAARGQLDQLAS